MAAADCPLLTAQQSTVALPAVQSLALLQQLPHACTAMPPLLSTKTMKSHDYMCNNLRSKHQLVSVQAYRANLHLPSTEAASCMTCQGCGTAAAAAAAAISEASGCTMSCSLPPDGGMSMAPCLLHCLN